VTESLVDKLDRLFPDLVFEGNDVEWHGGKYVDGSRGPLSGKPYPNTKYPEYPIMPTLTLDGDFTCEELRALAEWMES
jgi:hypothetical protein